MPSPAQTRVAAGPRLPDWRRGWSSVESLNAVGSTNPKSACRAVVPILPQLEGCPSTGAYTSLQASQQRPGRSDCDLNEIHDRSLCHRDDRGRQRCPGGRHPQSCDPAARRLGCRSGRPRPARRDLQEARAEPGYPLRSGRAGVDPGADWGQHRHCDRLGRVGRSRHVRKGRAHSHHRQRDDRGARSLLVRAEPTRRSAGSRISTARPSRTH